MGLPYLKLEPEEAIRLLDHCIVSGYQIKDEINSDYFQNKSNVKDEKINTWQEKAIQWANDSLKTLEVIFVSLKESYNFRDAQVSIGVISGTNPKWNSIIKQIDARINRLNQYDTDIRGYFNIQVEIVGRDKIIQSGNKNHLETKN